MKELKLLIVEDDSNVIAIYTRDIDSYNKTNKDIRIKETILSDKDQALEVLRNSDNVFDGAVIDLDLKQSGGSDSSGNEIIKEVKDNLRFPVFVISGTSHNIDATLGEETSFFKVRDRDDDFDFIAELVTIYNTGITEILNRKGTIENYINDIFWNHLSSSLDLWINDKNRSPEEKQKSLLRYTLLHLQEYLDINSSGDLEKYHTAEFLITKPIKPNIFTGDILQTQQNKRCVVLTPACDIDLKNGKRKADKILTINIVNPNEIDPEFSNPKMSGGKKSKISQILNNSNPRYHCIPSSKEFSIGIIDFQDKQTIQSDSLDKAITDSRTERIATISHPFLKDIIARYSNYYSRQGSPDFDSDELFSSLFEG
jgi:hypothetical protein